jgi:hypothetical protein
LALLLDAGAFIAIDKRDPKVGAALRVAQQERVPLRTGAPVVAQVWREGAQQANLARVLAGVDVRPLDRGGARRAGELLAATATTDVADAHVALLAEPDDEVLTTDPEDIDRLLAARGVEARVIRV